MERRAASVSVIRGTPRTKPGEFFQNCLWPRPLPIPALFTASYRAGTAGHTMPPIHFAPFSSQRPGLGFCGVFFLSPFLHFEISTLDTEGQADPLLLYVNASHNVQAMSFPEGLNEVFGMLSMGLSLAWHMGHSGWLLGTAPPCHPVPLLCPCMEIPFPDGQDEAKIAKSHF